jgi:hypothetical protein
VIVMTSTVIVRSTDVLAARGELISQIPPGQHYRAHHECGEDAHGRRRRWDGPARATEAEAFLDGKRHEDSTHAREIAAWGC